ncbi:ABC transporter ATP-binding protein [Chitinasiproducens palmae]|uniref:Spermidine/putrescine import ATP-binding protein PotA n=1 Tax=Chitinasiproducens palmae TaxID=1770053 RepID=A0A1H2PKB2_9BURK|nr:ABC transporter ATP-binding protein [Chitinasiproducens palmae]SDV46737.1 putative spermidine/putrescine transport system ATP-binding protein [Chitinasiproducens palmae]
MAVVGLAAFVSLDMSVTRQFSGAALRLQGISKFYGDAAAVRALDLDIAPGEFVTLLGASGSGKTTTLMMLAGFVEPSEGRILIGDQDVTTLPPAKRELGVVFQNYSLFPHLSVAQNLAFPLEMRGLGRHVIRERVQALLEMVQLPQMAQRYPREMSGGQQQRVALARALIFEPRALLLDEPLGALDKNLREHMQTEIKSLHASLGTTMVMVTHDQEEALTLSDRVAVMHDGAIAQIGTPATLYERPVNRWVAEFIGQSNLLDGSVESIDDARAVVRLDSGARLVAPRAAGLAAGARASALLRPERLRLERKGQTTAIDATVLDGTVLDLVYLGHTVKYRVRLPDGQTLIAQIPNTGEPGRPQSGDLVTLRLSADCAWLMPCEGAAS